MSLRPPGSFQPLDAIIHGAASLEAEILAEKAAALGRTGEAVVRALAAYRASVDPQRRLLAFAAAEALQGLFIQRELLGMRSHADVVRQLDVPPAVLLKIGAKPEPSD